MAYKERLKLECLESKADRACRALGCDTDISHMRSDAKYCSNACLIRQRTPQQRRAYRLASKYGITPDDYDAMVAKQNNRCAICKNSDPKTDHGFWHVDHNHETDEVRGLLCSTCNTGIGQFFDNPDLLISAAKYLAD